jgi:hypothetical protein
MSEFLLHLVKDVIQTFFTVMTTAFATFLSTKIMSDSKKMENRKTTHRARRSGFPKKRFKS